MIEDVNMFLIRPELCCLRLSSDLLQITLCNENMIEKDKEMS